MKTQNDQQHKERDTKTKWFFHLQIVDCARPPLCLVHQEEVTEDKCPRCVDMVRRSLQ